MLSYTVLFVWNQADLSSVFFTGREDKSVAQLLVSGVFIGFLMQKVFHLLVEYCFFQ